MPVYDENGNALATVYDENGDALATAYDENGNIIFTSELNLKIMTYNCGGWYTGTGQSVPSAYDAQYYELQNGMIEENDPDILCINEYRDQFTTGGRTALSVLSPYFQYIETAGGSTDYYGHAICSKYPILSYTDNYYSNDSRRYYGKAVINVNGRILNVIVTHLVTSSNVAKRPAQSAELLSYVEELDNVIVCGDFNVHCRSKDYLYEITNRYEWVESYKPWDDAGYNFANNNDDFGFIGTMWNSNPSTEATAGWWSLDNILVSPNISINDVYVDETKKTDPITSDPNWLIDHIPFIAEITI